MHTSLRQLVSHPFFHWTVALRAINALFETTLEQRPSEKTRQNDISLNCHHMIVHVTIVITASTDHFLLGL
jgi:hypothetical protein